MIFCVDDDSAIRDIEVYTLTSVGFSARGVADSEELFAALNEETPELIILDIMLPGEDGVGILKKLRKSAATAKIPVIMATARGTEFDKIQSLDLGADDYLVKPFGMMEMVSRVKAVLRRCAVSGNLSELSAAGITMDLNAHTVSVDGKRIALTYKEFELLRLFMSHPGIVFSRDQILSEVWGTDYYGETRTVDMHIKTLRQKIFPYGALIETVIHVGYRMEVPS